MEIPDSIPLAQLLLDDEPSADSDRTYLEKNAIALLSNYQEQSIDPRDDGWLGQYSQSREIRESGLWNVNHVSDQYDSGFLDLFENAIADTTPSWSAFSPLYHRHVAADIKGFSEALEFMRGAHRISQPTDSGEIALDRVDSMAVRGFESWTRTAY